MIRSAWIRTVWVYLMIVVATVYAGGSVVLSYFLWPSHFRRRAHRFTAEWSAIVLWAAGTRLVLENAERLGSDRAQILVANHQSWFDIFALAAALPVRYSFVGKKELSSVPFLGAAWEKVGHIAIDRSNRAAAMASLKRVNDQFREGRTVIFFAEGTRSATGELGPFKKGAFVMAIEAGVPVVPVAVTGTREIMKKDSWRISRGVARVRVGRPISTSDLTVRDRGRLAGECREAVAGLMNGKA